MTNYVLVTGASGHVGAALVREFTHAGYSVIAHTREGTSSREFAARHVVADLARDADAVRMGAEIRSIITESDHLVSVIANAAAQDTGALGDLTMGDWSAMLEATFLSAVRTVNATSAMLTDGGSIVTISSVEAQAAFVRHAHYASAKAALEAYTRALALEMAPRGIRANAVAPGLIERDGLAQAWPEGWEWWTRTAPLRRPVRVEEVTSAVRFMATASGVSGQVLSVDGGWSASARQ